MSHDEAARLAAELRRLTAEQAHQSTLGRLEDELRALGSERKSLREQKSDTREVMTRLQQKITEACSMGMSERRAATASGCARKTVRVALGKGGYN